MKERSLQILWWWAGALSWAWVALQVRGPAEIPTPCDEEGLEVAPARPSPFEVQETATAEEEFKSPVPEEASGFVVDQNGSLVAHAWIYFSGTPSGGVLSAEDGAFRIPVSADRPARVWCLGHPAREDDSGVGCVGTDEVAARAGDTGLVLHARMFEPGQSTTEVLVRVLVRVLDPYGRPLSGFEVSGAGRSSVSDACGLAILSVSSGEEFLPRVQAPAEFVPGQDWLLPQPEALLPGTGECRVQYRLGSWVQGSLMTPEGSPASDVIVYLVRGRSAGAETKSLEDGTFSLLVDPLERDSFHVVAYSQPGAARSFVGSGWNLRPGGKPTVIQLIEEP